MNEVAWVVLTGGVLFISGITGLIHVRNRAGMMVSMILLFQASILIFVMATRQHGTPAGEITGILELFAALAGIIMVLTLISPSFQPPGSGGSEPPGTKL